jgi:hypothetical protein
MWGGNQGWMVYRVCPFPSRLQTKGRGTDQEAGLKDQRYMAECGTSLWLPGYGLVESAAAVMWPEVRYEVTIFSKVGCMS